jgi:glycosyltransferase involved in cell wall biosynthesis
LSTYTAPFYDGKLRALADKGIETVTFAGESGSLWGDQSGSRAGSGYTVTLLRRRFASTRALARLDGCERLVRELDPALIHIEAEPWQGVALQGMQLARKLRVPVGVQFAENGPRMGGIAGLVRGWVASHVLRQCSYAVGWSSGSSEIARSLAPRIHVETFPGTGVPTSRLATDKDPRVWYGADSAAMPKVAFVGRFSREKGILDFLDIADKVVDVLPARIALVGDGPYRDRVRAWSDVRPWVKLHGVLPRPEAIEVMSLADVLVCPSRTTRTVKEQFSQVAVEAMTQGTPVFAYACGALPEVIGRGGTTVTEGDVASFVASLVAYLANETDRTPYKYFARSQAVKFSEEAIANRLRSLWLNYVEPANLGNHGSPGGTEAYPASTDN